MALLKYIALGAAAAYGISQLVKKRESDGKSIIDDLSEQAPEWLDTLKKYGGDMLSKTSEKAEPVVETVQSSM